MESAAARRGYRRIVVTGIGAVSGLGWGVEPLWRGLLAGRPAIRPFGRFDSTRHRTHLAAEVPSPPPGLPHLPPDDPRLSLADRFALFAAAEALAGADLALPSGAPAGVFFGSSTGGMWESELFFAAFSELRGERGQSRLHGLASQQVNGPGDAVARHLGLTGPVETYSSACASGALALAAALQALRSGEIDVALAGGSDSLCQLTYAGFNSLRSVDERACRPFHADREGLSLGEGAAVLVLEPLEAALARGAVPLAELAGAGSACDAHHMTAPEPAGSGAAAAMTAALADAGLPPGAIGFVNAHATGTTLNDSAEWQALSEVFGERSRRLPVTATKSIVGHLLGSAGAIEALVVVLSLLHGELHPAPAEPGGGPIDPEAPAALVSGRPLAIPEARAGISTSLAFGGSNAALVLARVETAA
jgi:3-oxoacyl-(acyl-carrier-protein) synthase